MAFVRSASIMLAYVRDYALPARTAPWVPCYGRLKGVYLVCIFYWYPVLYCGKSHNNKL